MEVLAGPIPGENFTSDTKNYPWHRAPEFDDLDKAIEYSAKKLTAKNTSISMMTLVKSGVPISSVVEIFLMGGIMRGKWTVDYALLMAGPIAHILTLMAKASDIDYSLGIDDEPARYTSAYFKAMKELDESEEASIGVMGDVVGASLGGEEMTEEPSDQPAPVGGLAGAAMAGGPVSDASIDEVDNTPQAVEQPLPEEQGQL